MGMAKKWLPFQEKDKEQQVNSKILRMLIACQFYGFSARSCNSVGIGQNLINEVPTERSILADFAFFYRKSLNEKLNGAMKENSPGSKRTKKPKTVVKE